jgi:hypothetical protein
MHVLALAVDAALGAKVFLVLKIQKSGKPGIGLEDDVPAVATVPAIGPAARNVLLPPEGDAAIAAVAALNDNLGFVDEFHGGK